ILLLVRQAAVGLSILGSGYGEDLIAEIGISIRIRCARQKGERTNPRGAEKKTAPPHLPHDDPPIPHCLKFPRSIPQSAGVHLRPGVTLKPLNPTAHAGLSRF